MPTSDYRASDYLNSPEIIAAYLEEAIQDPDPMMLSIALQNIAEAKGINMVEEIPKENNQLSTLKNLLSSLGLKLSVQLSYPAVA